VSEHIILESLPDPVVASMESRDRWMAGLSYQTGGLEFLVSDLQAWTPGQTLRVAFLGGDPEVHAAIEEATRQITDAANLTLDFRKDGGFRTWSPSDRQYAAEIRVSFDQTGRFSLLGNDSVSLHIGASTGPVGGRPHQRSLNLEGFDVSPPSDFEGTVRHEFLHAVAFNHEHQNMRGPCEMSFRWEDDPGYQHTRDPLGTFVKDANGRRPGIYTYLSGFPNFWPRAKVDHNLRGVQEGPGATAGSFDPASCMLYRFPPMFYRTNPSPCAPTGNGQNLSEGDRLGLQRLYPQRPQALQEINSRRRELADRIERTIGDGGAPESGGKAAPTLAADAVTHLRASLT
jgi:hypothetical protein